jgi:uncharacterized protein
MNRRTFLNSTPLAAATGLALDGLAARAERAAAKHNLLAAEGDGAYGPLRPAKEADTGETLIALPAGFSYRAFGRTGGRMADGSMTPRGHDGMAAFAAGGTIRLVRNHEINDRAPRAGVALGKPERAYDAGAGGGTTTLVVDARTRRLVKDFVSLGGTLQNCAGGPTPWGTWLSCEETVLGAARLTDAQGRAVGGFAEPHGYCFEISASADAPAAAVPLRAMGRFVHEAVAVDPRTGVVYETEDYRGAAGFYRFLPRRRGKLAEGGRLQMLAVRGRANYDLRTGCRAGDPLPVAWVDIPDPDPPSAERDALSVFKQGRERGGATFTRLEGAWYGGGNIYFTSTDGGDRRCGQVWKYRPQGPRDNDAGTLVLLFESPGAAVMDMPDNLCVSPRGGLLVCEDGGGEEQYLRGLTPNGKAFDFARNLVPGYEKYEWAGATFSPDGETLFVNIQTPGITFAVWGPWRGGAL